MKQNLNLGNAIDGSSSNGLSSQGLYLAHGK